MTRGMMLLACVVCVTALGADMTVRVNALWTWPFLHYCFVT